MLDCIHRRERIISFLWEQDADIYCLQEVVDIESCFLKSAFQEEYFIFHAHNDPKYWFFVF